MKPDENVIDASKKVETAYDLVADILADSIGLYPTRKADAATVMHQRQRRQQKLNLRLCYDYSIQSCSVQYGDS